MTFVAPVFLVVACVTLPVAGALFVARERRRRVALERFGEVRLLALSSALPLEGRRFLRPALILATLGLGLLALARPQRGSRTTATRTGGHDVLFLLDLSRSMNAQDVAPSRLDAAKRAARLIARAEPDDRLGLAVFGGSAFLTLPLTVDHSAFGEFLDGAATIDLPDAGTDVGAAVAAAVQALLRDGAAGSRAVVLLSDGEDLAGAVDSVLPSLGHAGVPVFTIGFGTTAGGPIPLRRAGRDVGSLHDASGAAVVTRLDVATLRAVAAASGGSYVRWTNDAAVGETTRDLGRLESRTVTSRASAPLPEWFQWPLALAFVALILESTVPERPSLGRP
jgi:Ca-activated chloride channel family protein